MENKEKKVEAVLFAVGKGITAERLASLCGLKIKEVESIMDKLISIYNQRDDSLKIIAMDHGWKLTVKDEFLPLVSNIVSSTDLDQPLMDTLAVIAWKYPVVQAEIIKLRGSGAYEHIKMLEEQGFIAKEKSGRTFKVKLTQKFFEYFDLPSEEAKQAFLNHVPKEVLAEAELVEKEAEEVERLVELDQKEKSAKTEIKKAMDELKKDEKNS